MHIPKIIDIWIDEHLPCFEFGKLFAANSAAKICGNENGSFVSAMMNILAQVYL